MLWWGVLARRLALAVALCLSVLVPGVALGQQPVEPDEQRDRAIVTLEADIAAVGDALALADCPLACTSLASMRRAAERLCAIEPGPRCDAARARVDEAMRQVRSRCPDCEAAGVEHPAVTEPPEPAHGGSPEQPAPAAAPPEAGARGGCRGCAFGEGDAGALGLALVLGAIALLRRRRRR